jgi:hypothetical protein
MASISFKMNAGWKRMMRATDPGRFDSVLQNHVGAGTQRAALLAEKTMREGIRKGGFAKNASLTIHIKSSSTPLIDTGGLLRAITSKADRWDVGFAGILRSDELFEIAEMLHEGGSIRVTEKMRNMFQLLWFVSKGSADPGVLTGAARELWNRQPGGWFPLRESTSAIRIPPRPFVKRAFESFSLKQGVKREWNDSLRRVFAELAGSP